MMSKFFAWCVDQKRRLIKVSPMTGLTRPGVADARERVLNDDEVRWFWAACDELGHPFGTLFQFLLLTGARRDEGAALARGELSEAEDGTVWTIPARAQRTSARIGSRSRRWRPRSSAPRRRSRTAGSPSPRRAQPGCRGSRK